MSAQAENDAEPVDPGPWPSNQRLHELATRAEPQEDEVSEMALELLEHRRACGEAPERCEGCGKSPVAHHDCEGVPLCEVCFSSLNTEKPAEGVDL